MLLKRKQRLPTEEEVREANRILYNAQEIAVYEENDSLFNERQTVRLRNLIEEIREECAGESFLDVGCGTGNLLRIAQQVFPKAIGVDQAERLLSQVKNRDGSSLLAAAQAHRLPFPSESFDAVGMYAMLHHIVDPLPVLREAHRVLRPGGVLYTDHDPNHYLGRFYRLWYRLRYRAKHGFGSEIADLAEYHNVFTSGLNPQQLATALGEVGFCQVRLQYRHSTSDKTRSARWVILCMLKGMSAIAPLKSFYSHFLLRARKQAPRR